MSTKWITIAPLNEAFWLRTFSLPISFAESVTLDLIPSWARLPETLKHLGTVDAEQIKRSQYAFQVPFDADALGSPDPNPMLPFTRSIQEAKHELVSMANLACWVVKPCGLGFYAMMHFDEIDAEPQLRQYSHVRRFQPNEAYRKEILDNDAFLKAAEIHDILTKLDRKNTAWTAMYALWLGLCETDWASRFMQFWICLEALFGPQDAREMTFRISQRIAFFLETDPVKAKYIFDQTKKSYSWRSKIVHGLHLTKLTQEESGQLSIS